MEEKEIYINKTNDKMRTNCFTLAALALAFALAACTQDEPTDSNRLPEGAEGTPMTFTATGLTSPSPKMSSRATVDGNWQGVDTVAVMIDGTVKPYAVTADAADDTRATLASDDPFYWMEHANINVTAWWPCAEGETTPPAVKVKADQSTQAAFEGSDLIVADEAVNYGNPVLHFTHRTALVHIVLTDYTEGLDSVRLTGLSTEGGNPGIIIPYDKGNDTYSALVAPQKVNAGTAFITCTFTGGKTYGYRMQNTAEWKAGEEYTYTVSLAAADPGYTYDEAAHTYIVHNAKGLLAWNEAVQKDMSLNCTLAADINMTGIDWTPVGYYENRQYIVYTGTFDGGGHTITGLTIYLPDQDYVGLFGVVGDSGKVQNLTLAEVEINGSIDVGGVAGYSRGTVTGCTVSGDVTGNNTVGGVVGYIYSGTVTGCTVSGNVFGDRIVGGVAGVNDSGTVTGCYAAGNVSGNTYIGGVAGWNYGTVTGCYWSDYDGNGIGGGYVGDGDATKVDGTTVTWVDAQNGMNEAIDAWNDGNPYYSCNWHYEGATATTPPTLVASSNP